jgi:hypothetical protein
MEYVEKMENINSMLKFAHAVFVQYDLFQQLNGSFMFAHVI